MDNQIIIFILILLISGVLFYALVINKKKDNQIIDTSSEDAEIQRLLTEINNLNITTTANTTTNNITQSNATVSIEAQQILDKAKQLQEELNIVNKIKQDKLNTDQQKIINEQIKVEEENKLLQEKKKKEDDLMIKMCSNEYKLPCKNGFYSDQITDVNTKETTNCCFVDPFRNDQSIIDQINLTKIDVYKNFKVNSVIEFRTYIAGLFKENITNGAIEKSINTISNNIITKVKERLSTNLPTVLSKIVLSRYLEKLNLSLIKTYQLFSLQKYSLQINKIRNNINNQLAKPADDVKISPTNWIMMAYDLFTQKMSEDNSYFSNTGISNIITDINNKTNKKFEETVNKSNINTPVIVGPYT